MKISSELNAGIVRLICFDKNANFTENDIRMISKYGFKNIDKPTTNKDPNNTIVTDNNGKCDNNISSNFTSSGYLRDQTTVTKGHIYKAYINNKTVDVICITSGDWVVGTEVPDIKFKIYDLKSIDKR